VKFNPYEVRDWCGPYVFKATYIVTSLELDNNEKVRIKTQDTLGRPTAGNSA